MPRKNKPGLFLKKNVPLNLVWATPTRNEVYIYICKSLCVWLQLAQLTGKSIIDTQTSKSLKGQPKCKEILRHFACICTCKLV